MLKQVQFNEPPIEMQETVLNHLQPFTDQIPEGKIGGIFGILTLSPEGDKIMNAVVAIKVKDRLDISGYIGKTWGKDNVVYGIEVKLFF